MLTNRELDRLEPYLHKLRKDYPTQSQLDSDNDVTDEQKVEPELRKLITEFKNEPGPERGFGGADPEKFSLVLLRLTAFLFYDRIISLVQRQRASNDKPLLDTKVADMTGKQLSEIIENAVRKAATGK